MCRDGENAVWAGLRAAFPGDASTIGVRCPGFVIYPALQVDNHF